jgi:hypothetical protein
MLVAEGIEHQEGIQPALQIRRQQAGQANARAVGGRDALDEALHRSE